MTAYLSALLSWTRLGWLPVRISKGSLRGCRWTLWPHSAYWRGNYEPEVQTALTRHGPTAGSAAWDLGAHFGFYSLLFSRAVGPTGQVVALEPDPTSFSRLCLHAKLNPWAPLRMFPFAASDAEATACLIQSHGAGSTTSHLPYPGEKPIGPHTSEIQTTTLDLLAAREKLKPPTHIKIDVEGHAGAALRGAGQLLSLHHPRLLVSLHSPEECQRARAVLEPLGYIPSDLDDRPIKWEEALFRTVWYQATL